MTPQFFYDEFYISPPQMHENNIIARISELFNDTNHNMLCMKGEAGSGKSTFIKTMAVKGLDEGSSASYYRFHILDCAKTDGENPKLFPCASLEREIRNELRRMKRASANNGALWESYLMHVLAKIELLDNYTTDDNIKGFIDYIVYVLQQISRYGIQSYSILAKYLASEGSANKYDPWMHLALFLIILVCKNCLFGKDEQRKHVIAFDSIEAYTEHVATPVPEVFYNANRLLQKLFIFLTSKMFSVITWLLILLMNQNL